MVRSVRTEQTEPGTIHRFQEFDEQAVAPVSMDTPKDGRRKPMLRSDRIALGFLVVGIMGFFVHLHPSTDRTRYAAAPPVPEAVFACQRGDGTASCIPIRRGNGKWAMVPVSSNGVLDSGSEVDGIMILNVDSQDRIVFLDHGTHYVPPGYVRSGKTYLPGLDLHDDVLVPVLMPDGSLVLAASKNDRLVLSKARKVATMANPAMPESMVAAALAALSNSSVTGSAR